MNNNKNNTLVDDPVQVVVEEEGQEKRFVVKKRINRSSAFHIITLTENEAKNLYLLLGKELGYLFVNDSVESVEKERKNRRSEFSLTDSQIDSIEITDESLTLKELVKLINKQVDKTIMKSLSITPVNKWLVKNGYLSEEKTTRTVYKTVRVITEKASEIGISEQVIVDDATGKVIMSQIEYSPEAQRYILSHLADILES